LRKAASSVRSSFQAGRAESQSGDTAPDAGAAAQPEWARKMNRARAISSGASIAAHSVRGGDQGGSSTQINLKED